MDFLWTFAGCFGVLVGTPFSFIMSVLSIIAILNGSRREILPYLVILFSSILLVTLGLFALRTQGWLPDFRSF